MSEFLGHEFPVHFRFKFNGMAEQIDHHIFAQRTRRYDCVHLVAVSAATPYAPLQLPIAVICGA